MEIDIDKDYNIDIDIDQNINIDIDYNIDIAGDPAIWAGYPAIQAG